jgi:hypothetical protein
VGEPERRVEVNVVDTITVTLLATHLIISLLHYLKK